jgi:hypothetical protein
MTAPTDDTIKLQGHGTPVEVPGVGVLMLDLVEFSRMVRTVSEDCQAKGLKNFEYLDKVREWLKANYQVDVPADQADALVDAVGVTFAKKKQAVRALLSSLNSTDPPPSASDPDFN